MIAHAPVRFSRGASESPARISPWAHDPWSNYAMNATPASRCSAVLSRAFGASAFCLNRVPRVMAVAVVIAILGRQCLGELPTAWRDFSPPGGGFSIRMPGDVSEHTDQQMGGHTFQVRSEDEWSYIVTYADLVPELKALGTEKLLRQMREQLLEGMKASLVSSENLKVQGFPAVRWTLESGIPNRPVFRMRMITVVTDKRLFNVGVIIRKDQFRDSEVNRFLTSFRLEAPAK